MAEQYTGNDPGPRPILGDHTKISVRLPVDLLKEIDGLSISRKQPRSEVIRKILARALRKR